MYQGYKIVVNTAAGRRRYMQYLVPPILESDIVDRYDIWINTHNMLDIEFFSQLAKHYSKVNLVWQPDGIVNGIQSINAFYRNCIEDKTIYMKLDDDVVWFEPDLFKKMVKFRVENRNAFLVSPLVINNSLSTYLLQIHNKIKLNKYYEAQCSHPILWENGKFAVELHHWFIQNYLIPNNYSELYIGKQPWGITRFSINCILWFGEDMKVFHGIVPGDDEDFLSCVYPSQNGLYNYINGDAIISHFAFGPQRVQLDQAQILEKYGEILYKLWKKTPKLNEINECIIKILKDIEEQKEILALKSSPYKKVNQPQKKNLYFRNILPKKIRRALRIIMEKEPLQYIQK